METDSENTSMDTTIEITAAPKVTAPRSRRAKNGAVGAAVRAATTKPKSAKKGAPSAKAKAARGKLVKAPRVRGRTELSIEEMTDAERKLLRTLYTPSGPRVMKALHELQKEIWPKKTGTTMVRNTLRRLVKFGWLEVATPTKAELAAHAKAKSGRLYSKYQVTEKGRKRGIKG